MKAPRIDSTHNAIVCALRDMGASVTSLAAVGLGVPDLVVGWRRENFLLEVKSEKGQLNPYQKAFHRMWNGQVAVVRTPDDALRAIGAMKGRQSVGDNTTQTSPRFTVPQAIAYANGISDLYGSHFKNCLLTLITAAKQSLAPPLPPEVVAVLRAIEAETMSFDDIQAVTRWRDAGRPGLPPRAGAKGGE
jgi:hypothetical protein